MKLIDPTDFEILEALEENGRNTPTNIALMLDKDQGYVATRLPHLLSYDLVKRIGPAENSGLYEITDRGRRTIEHWDDYGDPDTDFKKLIEQEPNGV
ncbi:winged helix-turn-helix domain-containing protein [Halorussus marinus]|uniref:winged helix-turn-helix domain-containing protein n=1 Tax=Halorussus marinus TaxID=2505976 RepID=UPI00109194EA|nr:winged helix-turn-helix domain-containing protein [Halorussus marinus]